MIVGIGSSLFQGTVMNLQGLFLPQCVKFYGNPDRPCSVPVQLTIENLKSKIRRGYFSQLLAGEGIFARKKKHDCGVRYCATSRPHSFNKRQSRGHNRLPTTSFLSLKQKGKRTTMTTFCHVESDGCPKRAAEWEFRLCCLVEIVGYRKESKFSSGA